MKNFKFLLKLILAILPIAAIIIYTALVPFGYMDMEYPSWKYTKDIVQHDANVYTKLSASQDGPTAVFVAGKNGDVSDVRAASIVSTAIIGDSRAMADLIPEKFDNLTVNLAVGGATSIEMYYTLNNFIKNNGCPEKVIIMFAPFHYTIIDNFWTRTAYFNYLSMSEMYDLYSYAKAANSETLMIKSYKNDLLSYRLRFPDKYLPALMNSKFAGRYSENKAAYSNITANFGYGEFGTEDGCSDLNYEASYDRMHTTGDAVLLDIYMNRLLSLCESNNIETYLAIPPMNRSSYEALKSSYVEEFTEYMKELERKHPGISVEQDIPMYEDEYFGDSSHLNHKGAELFTDEFVLSH